MSDFDVVTGPSPTRLPAPPPAQRKPAQPKEARPQPAERDKTRE